MVRDYDKILKECHLCFGKTGLISCIVCGYYYCQAHFREHTTPGYWGVIPKLVVARVTST